MPLIDAWFQETTTSAIPAQVKELACYITAASFAQAQERKFKYLNQAGVVQDLPHVKTISCSVILSGKPGSYKSECCRFVKRILEHTQVPYIYPHDQVSREYMLSTLINEQDNKKLTSISSTIVIDELVNFLNRKEYVEPLVGTLNALLDQPDTYASGTHRRGSEVLKKPVINLIAACAPSWFKHLPEALFTGGFAGRCMFYDVPYPSELERQPRGSVCLPGAEARLAQELINMPNGHLVLTYRAIQLHDMWEMSFGREDAHPLPVLDEWFKRRAIQTVRLAGGVALARGTTLIDDDEMLEANKHLEHVMKSVEKVWHEVDTDDVTAYRMLQLTLTGTKLTLNDTNNVATKYLRDPIRAQRIVSWWLEHRILKPVSNTTPQLYELSQ